jgi:hypothetical protein
MTILMYNITVTFFYYRSSAEESQKKNGVEGPESDTPWLGPLHVERIFTGFLSVHTVHTKHCTTPAKKYVKRFKVKGSDVFRGARGGNHLGQHIFWSGIRFLHGPFHVDEQ